VLAIGVLGEKWLMTRRLTRFLAGLLWYWRRFMLEYLFEDVLYGLDSNIIDDQDVEDTSFTAIC